MASLRPQTRISAPPSATTPNIGIWNDACFASNMTVANPQCTIGGASLAVGSTVIVDVNVTNAPSFNGYEFSLFYDATNLTLSKINLDSGTVFDTPYAAANDTSTWGTVRESVVSLNGQFDGGFGVLAYFTFKIKGVGASPFVLAAGTSNPAEGGGATQFDWTRLQLGGTSIDVSISDGYFQNENNPPLTALKTDPLIKFIDSNNNGSWDSGETVVYDTNNNGVYDSGETVIAGPPPTAGVPVKTDPHIQYVDTNGDNVWNNPETVVYDSNNNNTYEPSDSLIAGVAPPTPKLGPVASFTFSPAKPQKGQSIRFDASASFDADNPGSSLHYVWDFGDGVSVPTNLPIQHHSYGAGGTLYTGNFSVLLKVFDPDNNFTGMAVNLVNIIPPPFHDVAVSSVSVIPTIAQPGNKISVTVTVTNTIKSTFDETYNLSITWGPPTRSLKNYTDQGISHQFGKNTKSYTDTLDTTGLSSGIFEVDAFAADPLDNDTSNNAAKAVFTIQLSQTSPLPYIIGGAVAVVAALIVVRFVLKRRRAPVDE